MRNPIMVLMEGIFKGRVFSDASLISLIASNIFTIIFALINKLDFLTIIWIYWAQSVIIGLANVVRILALKDFSTEKLYLNGVQPKVNKSTKINVGIFFLAHYGGFHALYFLVLFSSYIETPNVQFILMNSFIFFINHLFSLFYNRNENQTKINIGTLMFMPYIRIIPMHLIIILFAGIMWLPGSNSILLIIFLLLKTVADAVSHVVEHAIKRNNSVTTE